MPRETGVSYDPENDALPEPKGGYTKEYIEEDIGKREIKIGEMEVRIDALKREISKGKYPEMKEDFEKDIEDFERKIKTERVIIEKERNKIGELALEKEFEPGKHE